MANKPVSPIEEVVVAPDVAPLPAAVTNIPKPKAPPKPKSPPVKTPPVKKAPPPPAKKIPSTVAKAAMADKTIGLAQPKSPVHQNLVGVHAIEYQVVSKFNLQDLSYEVANLLNEQIPWQLSGGVAFAERPGVWVQTLIRHKM